jgi:diaminopimelate epimerase
VLTGGIPFVKGHGTENDFVLLPDPDAILELTAGRVAALCDRRRGLGADGVLRVVRAKALKSDTVHSPASGASQSDRSDADDDDDGWFMDYRNADGSVAEMCGNGMRLFARYLVESGMEPAREFVIASRGGTHPVVVHSGGTVTVDMGPVEVVGRSVASVAGHTYPGVAVDVGNPHLVCVLDGGALDQMDLTVPPGHDEQLFPRGVNVEFVVTPEPGLLRMRVYERGVGETRSCGTGTVAATAAQLHLMGQTTGQAIVDVPGGRIHVTIDEHTSTLTGPTMFVARGELNPAWWNACG